MVLNWCGEIVQHDSMVNFVCSKGEVHYGVGEGGVDNSAALAYMLESLAYTKDSASPRNVLKFHVSPRISNFTTLLKGHCNKVG